MFNQIKRVLLLIGLAANLCYDVYGLGRSLFGQYGMQYPAAIIAMAIFSVLTLMMLITAWKFSYRDEVEVVS